MLWYRIKNNQLSYKFRRQHGIGKYVVDFFCPQLKLIVEIDGGVHFEDKNILADKEREKYLKNLGLRIIRYNNLDITKNIDNVLNNLIEVIKTKE